jgi:hypothetical protein
MGSLSGWLMLFGMMARPLAISLLQTQGDVVFRVLAPKLFPVGIAWLWFVLVIIQYVGFPNGNIFHFRSDLVLHNTTERH